MHCPQLFKLLVGRSQRAVHTLDVVPALPPLDDYRPVDYGRWIPRNQTVVVQVPAPCVPLPLHSSSAFDVLLPPCAAGKRRHSLGLCLPASKGQEYMQSPGSLPCRTVQQHRPWTPTTGCAFFH